MNALPLRRGPTPGAPSPSAAPQSARVIPLPAARRPMGPRIAAAARDVAGIVLPPVVTLTLALVVWELAARSNPAGWGVKYRIS